MNTTWIKEDEESTDIVYRRSTRVSGPLRHPKSWNDWGFHQPGGWTRPHNLRRKPIKREGKRKWS